MPRVGPLFVVEASIALPGGLRTLFPLQGALPPGAIGPGAAIELRGPAGARVAARVHSVTTSPRLAVAVEGLAGDVPELAEAWPAGALDRLPPPAETRARDASDDERGDHAEGFFGRVAHLFGGDARVFVAPCPICGVEKARTAGDVVPCGACVAQLVVDGDVVREARMSALSATPWYKLPLWLLPRGVEPRWPAMCSICGAAPAHAEPVRGFQAGAAVDRHAYGVADFFLQNGLATRAMHPSWYDAVRSAGTAPIPTPPEFASWHYPVCGGGGVQHVPKGVAMWDDLTLAFRSYGYYRTFCFENGVAWVGAR